MIIVRLHRPHRSLRRGTILLLALLVLSTVTVASGGLGSLILNSLQQSRLMDSSVAAYYAAESAAEDGLYRLRRTDEVPGTYDASRQVYVTDATPLSNGSSWRREVAASEGSVAVDLNDGTFIELLLYDPENEGQALPTPIQSLVLSWTPLTCDAIACPRLSLSRVSWDPSAVVWAADGHWTKLFGPADTPATVDLTPSTRLHRVRIRAEGANFTDLLVEAFDISGNPVPIPGRARLDAWGKLGESEQHLVVRVPRRLPLGGSFDYAMFSECSIVKGFPIRCP